MPRVQLMTTDGERYEIRNIDTESVADLVDAFQAGDEPVLSIALGDLGCNDILHLARQHICGILIEG